MISQAQWLCVILTNFFEREPTISTITRESLTEYVSVYINTIVPVRINLTNVHHVVT